MSAKIIISLSDAGRKARILAGGSAEQYREITVEREAPEFAAVVERGYIDGTGIVWDTRYLWNFDALPDAGAVLARQRRDEEEKAEREAARQEEMVARTRAIISDRKVETRQEFVYAGEGRASLTLLSPAWHYGADRDVQESPEALAWVAELATQNAAPPAAARAAAQAEAEADRDRKAAAKEAAAQKLAAHRAGLGLCEGEEDYMVEAGALAQVPCWESHKRGKNWMAVISVSPSSPGGLARDFAEKAKGGSFYILPTLSPGDSIEFGADYYSGGGRKNSTRWYGYVVRVISETDGPGYLILHECKTGKAAVKAGAAFRARLAKEKTTQDVVA